MHRLILIGSVLFSAPLFADDGCLRNGSVLPLGTVIAIDKSHPDTLRWHAEFRLKHGVAPDGGAYKMALCSFVVNNNDYPSKLHREYVWVAHTSTMGIPSYADE